MWVILNGNVLSIGDGRLVFMYGLCSPARQLADKSIHKNKPPIADRQDVTVQNHPPVGSNDFRLVRAMSVKARTVNSRHLVKGDPLPPFTGTLRIYNMRYCPFAHRVILALNAKGLDYEVVNLSLSDKPDWIYTKNPQGQLPTIEISEGVTIQESLIISSYLDEAYPGSRTLQAEDPLVRARDRVILAFADALQPLLYMYVKSPELVDEQLLQSFYCNIEHIQAELVQRGTRFLGGAMPGYVDYMLWPWLERLPAYENKHGKLWPLAEKYGRLTDYILAMREDPAVSEYLIPDDVTIKFFEGMRVGQPRYDWLET